MVRTKTNRCTTMKKKRREWDDECSCDKKRDKRRRERDFIFTSLARVCCPTNSSAPLPSKISSRFQLQLRYPTFRSDLTDCVQAVFCVDSRTASFEMSSFCSKFRYLVRNSKTPKSK